MKQTRNAPENGWKRRTPTLRSDERREPRAAPNRQRAPGGAGVSAIERALSQPEPFAARVQALRENWIERRQVAGFATAHDYHHQFELLQALHAWAAHAAAEVTAVYGDAELVRLSPPPAAGGETAFELTVGGTHTLTFALAPRRRAGTAGWSIAARIRDADAAAPAVPAGPERRAGQWSSARVEELVLSLLGAYERSVAASEGGR